MTVPDSGVRDEHGMEPIENLFSSPGKSDHEEEQDDEEESDEYGSGEEAMDITTSTHTNLDRGKKRNQRGVRGLSNPSCSIRNRPSGLAQRTWE